MENNRPPSDMRRAAFVPSSLNADARTIELTWSTGSRGRRASWFDGDWYEELDMSPSAVRLDRLNSGAALLNSHQSSDLSNILGVVERAWIENGEGRAKVRFSERAEVEPIFRDVAAGIIRNVSVGYQVHQWSEPVRGSKDEPPTYRALDWEPMELSLVGVNFDAKAQTRTQTTNSLDTSMPDTLKSQAGGAPAEQQPDTQGRAADPNPQPEPVPAVDAELQRDAAALRRENQILKLASSAGLTAEQTDELVRSGKSVDEASVEAVRLMRIRLEGGDIRKGEVPALGHPARIAVTRDSGDTLVRAFGDEMERRVGLVKQPTEVGRQVLGYTMLEMCRMYLESRGVNTAGMSKNDLVSRGFHSTSDFPLLLENVSSKTLLAAYAEEPQTWKPLAVQRNLPDFKQVSDYQISGQVIPELTLEGGEYRTGTLVEGKSTWNLSTFTKKLTFTRQLIINDDLEAFQRTTNILGRGCNLLESNLAWDLITTSPNGATVSLTGNPLFHSSHNNTATGAGTDISIQGMDAAKLKLRNQKDIAGNRINLAPAYLLVPTTLETRALQFLFPTGYAPTQLTGNSGPNPFASGVQLIVEPRLDDAPAVWYLTSSPNRVEMMTYGYLAGEPGPTITTTEKRDPDGVEMLVRMDFGITLSDFRGFVRAAGQAPSAE